MRPITPWSLLLGLLVAPSAWAQDEAPAEEPAASAEEPAASAEEPAASTEEPAASEEPAPKKEKKDKAAEKAAANAAAEAMLAEPSAALTAELPPPSDSGGARLLVGLQLGPAFAFSPMTASVMPRFHVGAELPIMDRRLRPILAVAHQRPAIRGEATDDRVADGAWSYEVKESIWTIGLGTSFRLANGSFAPEVVVLPQIFLLRSRADGDAGAPFGETREYYTRGGFYLAPGARKELGPGELTGHLGFAWSPLNERVTGKSSTAEIVPTVGYQLLL